MYIRWRQRGKETEFSYYLNTNGKMLSSFNIESRGVVTAWACLTTA